MLELSTLAVDLCMSPSLAGSREPSCDHWAEAVPVAEVLWLWLWLWHHTLKTQDTYIGIKKLMSCDLPILNAMPLSL